MFCCMFSKFTIRAPRGMSSALGNQRGMALVLALVMLALMSLIGALALSTSSTEVGISGNYRSSQEAFFAAERAVEYAMTDETIYTTIGTGSVDLSNGASTETTHETSIRAGTSAKLREETGDVNRVTYVSTGPLPPGSGSDPTYFQSRYYIVTVTAEGPNNSSARIESQVARVVPK